jgi:NAD(P)-dependent dehydrogenase (short-subunit alcohol dehydrogenase family)
LSLRIATRSLWMRCARLHLPRLTQQAVNALQKKGKRAYGFVVDITDATKVKEMRDFVVARGGIDVLVNNAGVVFGGPLTGSSPCFCHALTLTEVPLEQHLKTIQVNLSGLITVTATMMPHLLGRKSVGKSLCFGMQAFILRAFKPICCLQKCTCLF